MGRRVDANVDVLEVVDGDTVDVRQADGVEYRVRIPGMQAMESDEPGSAQATAYAEALLRYGCRLTARDYASMSRRPNARHRRHVWGALSAIGPWVLVSEQICRAGWALAFSNDDEPDANAACFAAMREAKAAKRGLWNPEAFGVGPPAKVALDVLVNPPGSDATGEWVKITNGAAETLSLKGWHVRSHGVDGPAPKFRGYPFPDGAHIHPGRTLTLYTHEGADDPAQNVYFWGTEGHVFKNPNRELHSGDGVLLTDPLRNIRAHLDWGG